MTKGTAIEISERNFDRIVRLRFGIHHLKLVEISLLYFKPLRYMCEIRRTSFPASNELWC